MAVKLEDGAVGTPALHWNSSTNTGFYFTVSNIINLSSGGTQVARFFNGGEQVQQFYSFLADGNTGMQYISPTLTFRTSGHANPLTISSAGLITSNGTHNFNSPTGMQLGGNVIRPVVQVVTGTTNTQTSTTATAFTDTTSFVTITPKFSTSIIFVIASGNMTQEAGDISFATIARNGTNLAPDNGGFHGTRQNNNYYICMHTYNSPGSVAAQTYRVRIRTNGGGGFARYPVTAGAFTPAAVITAIEYGQ
jgi:hypothetical protein